MTKFLLRVWGLAKPYRLRLFLGVLTGFLAGVVSPLVIGTVMFVYSAVFPTSGQSGVAQLPMQRMPEFVQNWFYAARQALEQGVHAHPGMIVALIAAIPAIMLLSGILGYLNVYLLQWVASRAVADMRVRLFRHLLDLSAGFYSTNSSGQLIARVMNDTYALLNILNNAVSVVVRDPVSLISVLAFLLWQQPRLTLITMIVLPVVMIPIIVYSRKIRRSSREAQTLLAEQTQIMSEAFTGHRIVKAYNLEPIVAERFRSAARRFVSHYMRIVRAGSIPGPLIEFFGSCGVALLLAYLIYGRQGHPNPAVFLQLIGSVFYMYRPLKNLAQLQNQVVQARAASERAFALLDTRTTVIEPAQPRKLQAAAADIQFDQVCFSYDGKMALQDISLEVKSGQLLALVGASGSGKTTLTNLLLRFYDPARGSIKIGGVDLRDVSARELRSQIAVVTQEVILFDDTISRNIELGRPGATKDEIIAAAKHAHAYDFIMQRPEGFDAVIGEKGVMLSGGQRQRIAIARAVLRNAPILVLDEATSALDTESERAVQAALDELMKGRTTICIAHRLSTILHADLIVVLDQGRIVETGRHEALVQRGGVYQKLYELQFAS
ncbi:MAG TPA: ABC transporter transmembrane domain-containing protein [Candidatus Sulfopaludibacter sp.]|nr:ABC transporter transmembrane domain-containing protein [Candidatus Sulfopaludibacter sp.]